MVLSLEKFTLKKKPMKNSEYIKVIQTRKYKDINLYLRFTVENKGNIRCCLALLSKLVGDVSKKYPSKLEMTRIKDTLYGINMDVSYKARAKLLTFSIHYTFINPKFLEVTIDEYSDFIKETLHNSLFDEKTLKEAKAIISDSIRRRNDRPAYEAHERFIEIVSKDNPDFEVYSSNNKFINKLKKIGLDEIKRVYESILNKAQLNIYLCGDLSAKDIKILTDYNFDKRIKTSIKTRVIDYLPRRTVIDKKDISQSYLSVVYTSPFTRRHKDYFKWFMANYILGAAPTSLLFTEVREKKSLCYSIVSITYKYDGLVRISTSIDGKNKNIVIQEIMKQVERLKNRDYDPNILAMTRAYVINNIMGIYDDLDSLVEYYTECDLSGFNLTIEEYCDRIAEVSVEDISNIYKKYDHYFNYVLLESKHE